MSDANPFDDFVVEYYDDPVRFVREVLGADPLPYQAEFLSAIASGERKISVRSGHGTGKSTSASWAMLWFLFLRFPNKVVVTAPTSGQLFDALFAEMKRWINELPQNLKDMVTVKSDRVELTAAASEAFISARTSRAETPEALAGVHSEHVLLVIDEASGVPEKVFEAAAGSMSGHSATTVLLSNPTRSSGTFYESQTRMAGSWWTRRWSCVDSPLVSATSSLTRCARATGRRATRSASACLASFRWQMMTRSCRTTWPRPRCGATSRLRLTRAPCGRLIRRALAPTAPRSASARAA